MTTCPKCGYQRQASDRSTHAGICPSCGIAYAKYRPPAAASAAVSENPAVLDSEIIELVSFRQRLFNTVTHIPEHTDSTAFYGRAALFGIFVLWGASFMIAGIDWEKIGGSFLHNVNLAFHEFGHVLFGPFGRFMAILGGSLFQVLFPLVFVVAFSLQMRDNFAASICLWWCGQSFIDVSPYIADAPYRVLPLIGGLGEESHDWGNLLTMTNSVDSAPTLANLSFGIGVVIMLVSFAWGGAILRLQYRALNGEH